MNMLRYLKILPVKFSHIKEFKRYTCDDKTVGFAGLGRMGSVLAARLKTKLDTVYGYDVRSEARDKSKKNGIKICESLAELSEKCDIVFTVLPTFEQMSDAFIKEKGLLSSPKKNTLYVDFTTIGPIGAIRINKLVTEHGCCYLDAPVSGGLNEAKVGKSIFLVGGCKEYLEIVKPYLNTLGNRIFYCGAEIGDGQTARLCNLIMYLTALATTAEVMNLGDRLGLNLKVLADVINSSSGQSWASKNKMPVPNIYKNMAANNNYEGINPIDLLLRIIPVAQNAATATETPMPMMSMVFSLYTIIAARGYAHKDISVIYKFFQQTLLPQH